MSNTIYLSIKGRIQGLVSEDCGSYASIGSKYQINHADEIFVLQLGHSLNREYNVVHHPIKFYKLVGKSSPPLNVALSENEELSAIFDFYKVNFGGRIERFYITKLQGAYLSNTLTCYPHSITHAGAYLSNILICYPRSTIRVDNQSEDVTVLNYKGITWKHHIAGTESHSCREERIF